MLSLHISLNHFFNLNFLCMQRNFIRINVYNIVSFFFYREQAAVTGDRLKALNIKFNRMTISTMVRAQETGNIIGEKFPELPKEHCSLLQEGAPYPPVPSSKSWTPDRSVRNNDITNNDIIDYFQRVSFVALDIGYEVTHTFY